MDNKKTLFVIGPIGEAGSDVRKTADDFLDFIVKPVCADQYEIVRADLLDDPGQITSQIVQHLRDDDLVIADITGGNPNVFYELAIRHVTAKACIQLVNKNHPLPFDVSQMRTIPFDLSDPREIEETKARISSQIEKCNKDGYRLVNTVSMELNFADLEIDTKEILVDILDRIDELHDTV
ncbi:unnamed protein product, partial [Discosporangium mesarthrocarpum]